VVVTGAAGTVTSDPSGIDCTSTGTSPSPSPSTGTSTCKQSHSFNDGTITLTANYDHGKYYVSSWDGVNCTGSTGGTSDTCTLQLGVYTTVTVNLNSNVG